MNILEQAQETKVPVYSSSWDIKMAFDSITRPLMALAWNRLGVPPQLRNGRLIWTTGVQRLIWTTGVQS